VKSSALLVNIRDDGGPPFGVEFGGGTADARACTGYDGDFVLKGIHNWFLLIGYKRGDVRALYIFLLIKLEAVEIGKMVA